MDAELFAHWLHTDSKYGGGSAARAGATRRGALVVEGGLVLPWAVTAMLVGMVAMCLYFAVTDNVRLDPLLPTCLRPKRARA